jgi:N-acetylglucosaminyldiphosphoundecaprenol N-acetyl-beta-D-mannosaminyltransferase
MPERSVSGGDPDSSNEPPTVMLDGVRIHATTASAAARLIAASAAQSHGGWAMSVNLHHLRLRRLQPRYAEICAGATLVLADGMPVVWASRVQGTRLPERVAGSDLVSLVACEAARHGLALFLLGAQPGVAHRAAELLSEDYPGLRIAGTLCPSFGFERDEAERRRVVNAVVEARPHLVYVALGKPLQEWLIAEMRPHLPETWFVGVGIGLSFLAGAVRRAPHWMQRSGLEWLHRLVQEPRRLGARYLLGGPPQAVRLFAAACVARVRGQR